MTALIMLGKINSVADKGENLSFRIRDKNINMLCSAYKPPIIDYIKLHLELYPDKHFVLANGYLLKGVTRYNTPVFTFIVNDIEFFDSEDITNEYNINCPKYADRNILKKEIFEE